MFRFTAELNPEIYKMLAAKAAGDRNGRPTNVRSTVVRGKVMLNIFAASDFSSFTAGQMSLV